MRRHGPSSITVAALLVPGLAHADTGGGGEWVIAVLFVYACIYYVVLCLFSIPLSLLLGGSMFKRIAIGIVVPLIGIGLGAWIVATLDRMHYMYYVDNDGNMVFFVISSIPIVFLVIWVIFSRARAEAFERSRVQYAEYLEREKALAKLADANFAAQMTLNNAFERTVTHRGRPVLAMDYVFARVHQRRRPAVQRNR